MNELKEHFEKNNQTNLLTKTDKYWVHYGNKKCIDLTCGNAAFSLGYGNHLIRAAMSGSEIDYIRDCDTDVCADSQTLAAYLCNFGFSSVSWTASGTDAVECAIYAVEQYWKSLGKDKKSVISFAPGYHGASMLARHLRGDNQWLNKSKVLTAPFWSYLEERESAEQIVLEEVERVLKFDNSVGAIVMETCPWIRVNPYSQHWWKTIRKLCDQYDVLFVLDDVAFFGGKAPTMIGYGHYNVEPDIVSIGKALTGGYSPLAATLINKKVRDVIDLLPWQYGHTYSPNIVGVRCALAAIPLIENSLSNIPRIQEQILSISADLELNTRYFGTMFCLDVPRKISDKELFNAGLIGRTTNNTFSICAPLIADDEYFNTLSIALTQLLH